MDCGSQEVLIIEEASAVARISVLQCFFRVASCEFVDRRFSPTDGDPRNHTKDHETADAFNVLAQIERDAGNTAAAVEAATKAYRLAWCDAPPFAYHWGLEKAKKHLEELGVPEPEMPPFDESKFEPMPEVEIDPDDEFHVGDVPDS